MKDGYGSVNVHFGADTRFSCITYADDPPTSPILTISTPGLSLALSGRTLGVQDGDVQNARRLLEVVSKFTAEVERLHALNNRTAENTAA